jgi:hypothetical protein
MFFPLQISLHDFRVMVTQVRQWLTFFDITIKNDGYKIVQKRKFYANSA